MSIKAFADLGLFTLFTTTDELVNDFSTAYDYLIDSEERKRKIAAFVRGVVERCRHKTEDLDWAFETDLTLQPDDYFVNYNDVYTAIVVAQFGPRMFPNVGPMEPSTVEKRYEYACKHFVTTLKDALAETGTGKHAEYSAISQPVADRLRFMFIELRRAAKGFEVSMEPYRYEMLTHRASELYGLLGGDWQTPDSEKVIRAKIDHIRDNLLTPDEDARFQQEIDEFSKQQRVELAAERARRETQSVLLLRVRDKALAARLRSLS